MELALDDRQLPLFKRLPVPRGAQPWRRPSRLRRIAVAVAQWAQIEFRFVLRALASAEDEDDEFDYPEQRRVRADEAPPPETRAAPSIFALAASIAADRAMRGADRPAFAHSAPAVLPSVAIVRESSAGITRHVGAMYPSGRWTEEREEAERARRARQRPPKPTKGAKTRSRKLLDLIGDDVDT